MAENKDNKLLFLKGTGTLPTDRVANNIYFKLGAPGEGQIALGENIWNESINIKSGDNVLAYSVDGGLSASLTLSYDEGAKKILLKGKNDAVLGEVDATAFLKDGMLSDVTYADNKLKFTFNIDAGKQEIEINVADLVDEYTAGDGILLDSHEFSVEIDSDSEDFLTVSENGVKLSGVQSAIDAAKTAAVTEANVASAAALAAANAAQGDVDTLEGNVAEIDDELSALTTKVDGHIADSDIHVTASDKIAWNAAESNAKTYADNKFQLKGEYEESGAAAQALVDAKAYADGLAGNYDSKGSATKAETAAKAYADSLAGNYDSKGSAAAAETAAKAYADGLAGNYEVAGAAATAEQNAKEYADSLAENYDAKGAAATALSTAKSYADSLAGNYDAKGSAAAAETAAKAYADGLAGNYDAKGSAAAAKNEAIIAAQEYADGLASNYEVAGAAATALEAAKADATSKANKAKSEAIADAEGKVNAAKAAINAYTVNGKEISTNPVLNGSEIKLDGFVAAEEGTAIVATDSVNVALAKLEKSISDVSAAAVKLGEQSGNVILDNTNGLTAHLEWGTF